MFKDRKLNKAKKQLKKSIRAAINNNVTKVDIIKKAKELGWTDEIIEEIFQKLEKKKKEEVEITIPIKKAKEPEEIKEEIDKEPKKGLLGQMEQMNERMDLITEKKKTEKKLHNKRFKLPYKVKSKLKKLAIKNKAMVLLLQGNRNIMPTLGERKYGMLLVGENIADGAVEATWLWKGKYPCYIQPEWDLRPISKNGIDEMRGNYTKKIESLKPDELYQDAIQNKRLADPQQIILRSMEAKESLMFKAKANMKSIILTIVVVIIIMAVLFGGGVI